uniref:IS1634 family transposase n=1 Tax=Oceanobacillus salinisoli TaxID=2678611 RepID=UPI0018CC6413|nr:transposase [Oceanobacillus salinisoli]
MNKDHDPLQQMNLALLFGEKSGLPVYYRKLPGNIADVKTIQNMLSNIDFLKLDKVKFVMDRGFYSEANINAFYEKHYKLLIAAKTSLKFVKQKLDEVRVSMVTRKHFSSKYGLYYVSFLMDWNYKQTKKRTGKVIDGKRRIYLHLFYNDQKATDDK